MSNITQNTIRKKNHFWPTVITEFLGGRKEGERENRRE